MRKTGTGTLHWSARIALAVALFAGSFALTVWALPNMELRPGGYPGKFTYDDVRDPSPDTYFVSRGQHALNHLTLYHDIGPSIDNARKADILIIGNSRALLGFSEKIFVSEAEKLGLRVFNLAMGHADSARLARDLLQRHDLRPRVLIVSGGWFFYGNRYSNWARQVIAMNRWQALKTYYEYSLAWELESRLHHYLPYLDQFHKRPGRWVHYRSKTNGWYRPTQIPRSRYPIKIGRERDSYARSLPVAQALKTEMEQRGTQMVLTLLPFRKVQSGHLKYLSRELGVPYILPPFDGLATADGSHLTPDSAEQVSRYIWEELMNLPEVRAKLNLPVKH